MTSHSGFHIGFFPSPKSIQNHRKEPLDVPSVRPKSWSSTCSVTLFANLYRCSFSPRISSFVGDCVINRFSFDQNKRAFVFIWFSAMTALVSPRWALVFSKYETGTFSDNSIWLWGAAIYGTEGGRGAWRMERILHGSSSSLWHEGGEETTPQRVGQIWRRKPEIAMKTSVSPHESWHKTSEELEGGPKTWHATSPGQCLDSSDPCGAVRKIKYLYGLV